MQPFEAQNSAAWLLSLLPNWECVLFVRSNYTAPRGRASWVWMHGGVEFAVFEREEVLIIGDEGIGGIVRESFQHLQDCEREGSLRLCTEKQLVDLLRERSVEIQISRKNPLYARAQHVVEVICGNQSSV